MGAVIVLGEAASSLPGWRCLSLWTATLLPEKGIPGLDERLGFLGERSVAYDSVECGYGRWSVGALGWVLGQQRLD